MSSMSMNFEFKINTTGEILQKRGLESGGRVQQYVDNAVLRFCDPYVPKDTGMLIDSGITHTNIGSGKVRYVTPYAKYQYYGVSKNGHALKYRGGGMRGKRWFERMKADHLRDILSGAASEAGADVK